MRLILTAPCHCVVYLIGRVIGRIGEHDLKLIGLGCEKLNVACFEVFRRQILQSHHQTLI